MENWVIQVNSTVFKLYAVKPVVRGHIWDNEKVTWYELTVFIELVVNAYELWNI
jgi:hypothetical protein